MKSILSLVLLSVAIVGTQASSAHDHSLHKRHSDLHARLSDANMLNVEKRSTKVKRCKKSAASGDKSSVKVSKPDTEPATPATKPGSSGGASVKGLIAVKDSKCGPSGAVTKTTATAGPNGSIDWLNCGLTKGGWNPPDVHVSDLISTDLTEALKDPKSPFKACSKYVDAFNNAASKNGIPAIMIASIAMQESSCNPSTVGGGGEQGLMQITKDKCKGAPGGNCKEPNFNIATGAAYLASQIKQNNDNVLIAVGSYNGWEPDLTVAKATAAKHSSCCRCQNNLDYLQQFFNGWMLNIDAYDVSPPLGKYFNLDSCPGDD